MQRQNNHGNHGLPTCSALLRPGSPTSTELGVLLLVFTPSTSSRIQTVGSSSPSLQREFTSSFRVSIYHLQEASLFSCGALGRLLAQSSCSQPFSFVLHNIVPFAGGSGISVSEEETSQCSICNYIPGLVFTVILFLKS